MTTGNENNEKTLAEITHIVETEGFSNLTDAEINQYIEAKISAAVDIAKSEVVLEALEDSVLEQRQVQEQLLNNSLERLHILQNRRSTLTEVTYE